MNPLCGYFIDNAKKLKNWLTKQPEVKEESLTDWLLYSLSESSPAIKYKQFNRIEEGRETGADWEWWFLFPNGKSFAARIQAKKLKPNADCYPGIAYSKHNKLQIERLLEDSAAKGMASFYVFYSTEDCKHAKCGNFMSHQGEGIFLAEAGHIRNEVILKGRKTLLPKDILAYTNPISCLFCCPDKYTSHFIELGFREYLRQYFPTYSENLSRDAVFQEVGFRQTPGYILEIADNEAIADSWEIEHRADVEEINAILVIDLRGMNGGFGTPHDSLSDLYRSFFNCLVNYFPDDQDLKMCLALLEHDIASYIWALREGASLGVTNEDIYEKYAKMSADLRCGKEWEKIYFYLKRKEV